MRQCDCDFGLFEQNWFDLIPNHFFFTLLLKWLSMIIIVVALVAGSSFSISSAETIENQPKRDFNQLPELIVKSASAGNRFIQQNGLLLTEKEKHCFCLNLFEIKKNPTVPEITLIFERVSFVIGNCPLAETDRIAWSEKLKGWAAWRTNTVESPVQFFSKGSISWCTRVNVYHYNILTM